MTTTLTLLFLTFLTLTWQGQCQNVTNDILDNDIIPPDRPCNFLLNSRDSHMQTPEIIERYGYPLEIHKVTTEDGYILQIHRIPAPGRPVVFLMHGVCSSSRDFVINCEKRALAFKLADANYDVWLGNVRGNPFSSHTSLSLGDSKFWDFSQDEMSQIDAPTMIDYVLEKTGKTKLSYVGMSMGNAIVLMMLTGRPEYNDKINVWFAMGATLDLKKTKSPVIRFATRYRRIIERAMRLRNHGEFFPARFYNFLHNYFARFCSSERQARNIDGICANIWFLFDGYSPQIPPEIWSFLIGEYPGRNSVKSMVQWFQWIDSGIMAMYDYGPWRNLMKYGTLRPKQYSLHELDTSVVLFGAKNDWIATQGTFEETRSIARASGAKVDLTIIPVNSSTWNHVDFVCGKDADILVYKHILNRLKEIYAK